MADNESNNLETRTLEWMSKGKTSDQITHGMLMDGFSSINGIPDNFYSGDDPHVRANLWKEYESKDSGPPNIYRD